MTMTNRLLIIYYLLFASVFHRHQLPTSSLNLQLSLNNCLHSTYKQSVSSTSNIILDNLFAIATVSHTVNQLLSSPVATDHNDDDDDDDNNDDGNDDVNGVV